MYKKYVRRRANSNQNNEVVSGIKAEVFKKDFSEEIFENSIKF